MAPENRRKKSDEWDSREKEWTDEMRWSLSHGPMKTRHTGIKKFNPKRRFRFMLVWLTILLGSLAAAAFTVYDPNTTYQAIFSIFSAIISGVVFLINYGRDIIVTVVNALSKNTLR